MAKRIFTAVRGTVYLTKCTTERKGFENFMRQDDQKWDLFKIAKSMVKHNQDIGEQCITNDDNVLLVSDEDQKIVWKSLAQSFLGIGIVSLKQIHLVVCFTYKQ